MRGKGGKMGVLGRTGGGADDMMVQPSLGRFASATNPALTKEGFLMADTTTFNYQEYMASRAWAEKKEGVLWRAGGRCERCKAEGRLQGHHLTYENVGHEYLNELLGVCRPCHEYLSAKREGDPATGRKEASWALSDWLPVLYLIYQFSGYRLGKEHGKPERWFREWDHVARHENRLP